jgi:hypothetical protein
VQQQGEGVMQAEGAAGDAYMRGATGQADEGGMSGFNAELPRLQRRQQADRLVRRAR